MNSAMRSLIRQNTWKQSYALLNDFNGLETPLSDPSQIQRVAVNLASSAFIINLPGVYELTGDYLGSDEVAIEIKSSDVILIGNGHSIQGDDTPSFSSGILINSGLSNVTISNVTISSWGYGITLGGDNCIIEKASIVALWCLYFVFQNVKRWQVIPYHLKTNIIWFV